jgi:mycothiol S-conjugate amidase
MQVHAHPDDEASKGAATTARYSSEGVRTVLVTCTGGEAGDILNPAADTPETRANLHAVRMAELHESVRICGYSQLYMLGYRDSGMAGTPENEHPDSFAKADFDEAVGRLVEIIRSERPHVILTYGDDHSGYPHPDHIRTHDITVVAFDAAGDRGRYPDLGEPWQPLKLYYMGWTLRRVQAVHDAIIKLGKESPYTDRLTEWKSDDERFMTRIDIGPWMAVRSKALLAHATQVAPDSFWFSLPDEMLTDVYPWEDFIRARSLVEVETDPDGFEADLFSGIPSPHSS